MKEISVTLYFGNGESVTTSYAESRMAEAFLLYAQYMHKLTQGQSVKMTTEVPKPIFEN